jgi:chemotaxis protein CheX
MSQIPEDIIAQLVASTHDVFVKMVFRELRSLTPIQGEALRPRSNVVGTVAFAGGRCGIVAFYTTTETAREIAGAMLGMAPAEVNGEMPDAIGEITNMIAGAFRTRMAAKEQPWAISIPAVTIGSDFYTKYVSDVQRVLCPFSMSDSEVFVELILTTS